MTGYLHANYVRSLSEFGEPRALARCRGWILERNVPGGAARDAMGAYPLFACADWSALAADVDELRGELVALSLVADPLSGATPQELARCFPDLVRPFKEHFVADLTRPVEAIVSRHHRRHVRAALRAVEVERCEHPVAHLDEWVALYDVLIRRHGIGGLRRFSRASFARQLEVPGALLLRARRAGETVAMTLWYVHGDAAFYHLGASSDDGYRVRASFALFARALEELRSRARWLDLGAGAGVRSSDDGLTRFKQGWATGTRTAYLCGRVLDRARYAALLARCGVREGAYFPAYREGEFA